MHNAFAVTSVFVSYLFLSLSLIKSDLVSNFQLASMRFSRFWTNKWPKLSHKILTAALQYGTTSRMCTPTLPIRYSTNCSPRNLRTRHLRCKKFAYKFRKSIPEMIYSSSTPSIHIFSLSSLLRLFWVSSRNWRNGWISCAILTVIPMCFLAPGWVRLLIFLNRSDKGLANKKIAKLS